MYLHLTSLTCSLHCAHGLQVARSALFHLETLGLANPTFADSETFPVSGYPILGKLAAHKVCSASLCSLERLSKR